jgi:predicted regulator of Ras-like GTPase activity (Roadblock/LC7/MglB family)
VAVAEKALADLADISSQVRAAVLFERGGQVLASTLAEERAGDLAAAAGLMLDQADVVRGEGETKVTQLEVATRDGSVFVVREGDQVLAATTRADPTAGLVFYDLRAALRSTAGKPKRRRAPAKKEKSDGSS